MPTRQYRDPSGILWEVFEVNRLNDRPNSVRPALSSGWLAFVSTNEKRRMPDYPPDWQELGEDELHELLLVAIVAVDPTTSTGRQSGRIQLPREAQAEAERFVERRRRPRPASSAPSAIPQAPSPGTEGGVTLANTMSPTTGGLPVPAPATVSSTLGAVGIEQLVRTHARQARRDGVAVIEGMIGVKRALTEAGENVSADVIKLLRKVFVDEFYFSG